MKIHFTLFSLFLAFSAFSQNPDSAAIDEKLYQQIQDPLIEDDDQIYVVTQKMPEFPGGIDSLLNFINENIRYTEEDIKNKVSGSVYVNFIVEKSGKLSDIKIVKGVSRDCDKEAIRILKSMPDWIPGEQSGVAVNVRYMLPIRFRLPE